MGGFVWVLFSYATGQHRRQNSKCRLLQMAELSELLRVKIKDFLKMNQSLFFTVYHCFRHFYIILTFIMILFVFIFRVLAYFQLIFSYIFLSYYVNLKI